MAEVLFLKNGVWDKKKKKGSKKNSLDEPSSNSSGDIVFS